MYFEERENDYVYRPEDRRQDILCPKSACLWNNSGVCSSVVNPTWIIPKKDIKDILDDGEDTSPKKDLNIWNEVEQTFDNIDDFRCVLAQYAPDYEE